MKIGIYIATEQKGFFITVGKILAAKHDVWFIARDRNVEEVIAKVLPELAHKTMVVSNIQTGLAGMDVLQEATEREKRYGERFSMLMSYDRALGQGYLFNADRYPHIARSSWTHREKLSLLLEECIRYEQILERVQFNLILGHDRPVLLDLLARYHGMMYLTLGLSRYEDRYIWFESLHEEKGLYTKLVKDYLAEKGVDPDAISYKQYDQYKDTAKSIDYSFPHATREASRKLLHQIYVRARGIQKRDSYVFWGWISTILRRPSRYRQVVKYGAKPQKIETYRWAYFALHQEPESALLNISPEFNNSMEIIAWVSKSLPADFLLVVKENPWSFGVRSARYYETLRKIPNVVLAHPDVSSWQWIKKASIVVAISGTTAFEAAYFCKPVLSFGKHQVINSLPTVRYADSFLKTRQGIDDLLMIPADSNELARSKVALHRALMDVSFSLPRYEKGYKSHDLNHDLATIAVNRIYTEYPNLFGAGNQEAISRRGAGQE